MAEIGRVQYIRTEILMAEQSLYSQKRKKGDLIYGGSNGGTITKVNRTKWAPSLTMQKTNHAKQAK